MEADYARALVSAYCLYVGAVVVSVPATLILTMLCGFLFGIVPGAMTALCAATTGAAIVFAIGRGPGADLLRRMGGTRLAALAEGFRRDAFGYIAFLRLLPIFPFWMTNLAPAACGALAPRETVQARGPQRSGMFFDRPDPEAIAGCVRGFIQQEHNFTREACRAQADQFSAELFRLRFSRFVDEQMAQHRAACEPRIRALPRLEAVS